MKKGQVALEFLVLIGLAFLAFLGLIAILLYHTEQLRDVKESEMVVDISLMVQNEITTASNVKDGYVREFRLPTTLEGKEYIVTQEGNKLYFKTANYEADVTVPDFEGEVVIGTNTINKTGGIVYINQ